MSTTAAPSAQKTALVTGASGGIGMAIARVLATRGFNLVLVARRADKLEALAAELAAAHAIKATAMPQDLSDPDAADDLLARCDAQGLAIDFLANNAGLAQFDAFFDTPLEDLLDLVQVNLTAVVHMARVFGARMVERGAGHILNVSSVTAFQPVPMLGTYAASKAFVLSLSESMATELKGKGVGVTALCPGFTDTSMVQNATEGEGGLHIPSFLMSTPEDVAREGVDGALAGKVVIIPGVANQLAVGVVKFQPRFLVRSIGGLASRFLTRAQDKD